MINVCISLNRKHTGIFITLCVFCIVAALFLSSSALNKAQSGKTNSDRVAYIESLGYAVVTAPIEVKTVRIPEDFNGVYNKYNELQKSSGFDLKEFCGEDVILYTYSVIGQSEPTNVHLIVFRGEIIGGDVAGTALDSKMVPLIKRS